MIRSHDVTVVVALMPGSHCVDAIVTGLGRQDEPRFALIIADARPTSAGGAGLAGAAAAAGINARIVPCPGASRAACNNLGIRLAATEFVLLLAHDFAPADRFVSAHLALHRRELDGRVVGIGPGLFPPELRLCPFRRWLEDSGEAFGTSFTAPEATLPRTFFYCGNASGRRRFLLEAGLFDQRFSYDAWDDAEFGARLARSGMRSVFVPGAVAWHQHPVTLDERCQTMRQAGASAALLERIAPGPHDWQAWARVPPWRIFAAARWRLLLSRVAPRHRRLREAGWRLKLVAAFVGAYQDARRGDAGRPGSRPGPPRASRDGR